MEIKKMNKYKGFNKDLMKEDLNEEELECYNKLMDGINKASIKEKDEVAHLMDIVVDMDEEIHTNCIRCGEEFTDKYEDLNDGNKRVYCNDCLSKMWGANVEDE